MVPCHNYHIYRIWTSRSRKVWRMLKKSSIGGGDASHKQVGSFTGKVGSHCVILLYCETLLQILLGIYCKIFYWRPLFIILLLLYVFQVGKAKKRNSKCPNETLNGLFQKHFQVFYFTPENQLSLTLPPSPCFFPLQCLYSNFWLQLSNLLIKAPLPILHSHKKLHYCN